MSFFSCFGKIILRFSENLGKYWEKCIVIISIYVGVKKEYRMKRKIDLCSFDERKNWGKRKIQHLGENVFEGWNKTLHNSNTTIKFLLWKHPTCWMPELCVSFIRQLFCFLFFGLWSTWQFILFDGKLSDYYCLGISRLTSVVDEVFFFVW